MVCLRRPKLLGAFVYQRLANFLFVEKTLNVVVCGKVIPASTVTIEIDPATKRMIRKGVPHELDPAAASAVEEGLRITNGAMTTATFGTVIGFAGVPIAAVGVYLWFFGPKPTAERNVTVVPTLAPDAAGLTAVGRF